jgi:hypothetical protein
MAGLSYDSMRNLILDNMPFLRDVTTFTPELLTAIFWEESGFQNIPQIGGGPAVGFGQVERPTIKMVNADFNTNFTPEKILADDGLSVQIASYTLSLLLKNTHNKRAALDGYAGASANPRNAPIPGRWLECERQLLAVHASDWSANHTAAFERLTYAAKPNSDPNLAFPSNRGIAV